MSQPPPPPNQPPSGGFGGPQDPSYGYPQQPGGPTPPPGQPSTPPPSGGYGYPQTPPPGGHYGYPQTPPPGQPPTGANPYATGQSPYNQPPTTPMPAPGGPQGGNGNKKIMMALAAVVAVAVVAVGTVFFVTKDDGGDDKPEAKKKPGQSEPKGDVKGDPGAVKDIPPSTIPKQDSDAEVAWEGDVPKGLEGDVSKQAHGVLFFGGNIIKYEPDGLVAYTIKDGKQVWKKKFIRGDSCNISPNSSLGGKALVQWGAKCEKVMGFDIAKGKKLWEKDLPGRNGEMASASRAHVAVSGDLGGVAWLGGRVGYRLSDGKELWSNTDPGCNDQAFAGGDNFIAIHQCILGTDGKVRKLDKDGKEVGSWPVPKGVEVKRVFSTSPLVLGLSPNGFSSDLNNIAVLDENTMELKKRIKVDPKRYRVTCQPTHSLDSCQNVVVDKDSDMIFLETDTYEGKERRTNAITGHNLTTGRLVWTTEPTKEGRTSPVGMHDGKLLSLEQGAYDGGGGVMQMNPKSGKMTPFLEFSADEREKVTSYGLSPYWVDNTLFMVASSLPRRIDDRTQWLVAIR